MANPVEGGVSFCCIVLLVFLYVVQFSLNFTWWRELMYAMNEGCTVACIFPQNIKSRVPTETPWVHVGCMDHIGWEYTSPHLPHFSRGLDFKLIGRWRILDRQHYLPFVSWTRQFVKTVGVGMAGMFFFRSYKEVILEPFQKILNKFWVARYFFG